MISLIAAWVVKGPDLGLDCDEQDTDLQGYSEVFDVSSAHHAVNSRDATGDDIEDTLNTEPN